MAKGYRFFLGCIALCLHLCVTDALGASSTREDSIRTALVDLAASQVGVMEVGYNAGPQVERYQRSSGNHRGQPWCASFVTWCFKTLGLRVPPGSGSAASFFPASKIIYRRGQFNQQRIKKGDLAGYRYSNSIHHIGIIQSWNDEFVITIEGNTGGGNGVQREGDGVHRMRRLKNQIALVSNWVPSNS